jgi:hypothetical protein
MSRRLMVRFGIVVLLVAWLIVPAAPRAAELACNNCPWYPHCNMWWICWDYCNFYHQQCWNDCDGYPPPYREECWDRCWEDYLQCEEFCWANCDCMCP